MSINPMLSTNFRLACYRIFSKTVFKFWSIWKRRKTGSSQTTRGVPTVLQDLKRPYWFHASSVGELESLTEVIFEALGAGTSVIVTVFSESARNPLFRLLNEAQRLALQMGWTGTIAGGFSPPEGEWEPLLKRFNPQAGIVWKYEAWPDLWASMARLEIPLVLLSAKPRSSLFWVKRILFFLGVPLPRLIITSLNQDGLEQMKKMFPQAETFLSGDPRWDRIKRRSETSNDRVKSIVDERKHFPRPWIVLGQVWPSDLLIWPDATELRKLGFKGTLWVVPHRIDLHHLSEFERLLHDKGYAFSRTLPLDPEQEIKNQMVDLKNFSPIIFVNEMGILLELYAHCDGVYVGGGFGQGIHSTMEPGYFGLPIACGPKNAHLFPEIESLSEQRQLRIVKEPKDLFSWIEKWNGSLLNEEVSKQRELEKNQRGDFWKSCTGESKRLFRLIYSSLDHPRGRRM